MAGTTGTAAVAAMAALPAEAAEIPAVAAPPVREKTIDREITIDNHFVRYKYRNFRHCQAFHGSSVRADSGSAAGTGGADKKFDYFDFALAVHTQVAFIKFYAPTIEDSIDRRNLAIKIANALNVEHQMAPKRIIYVRYGGCAICEGGYDTEGYHNVFTADGTGDGDADNGIMPWSCIDTSYPFNELIDPDTTFDFYGFEYKIRPTYGVYPDIRFEMMIYGIKFRFDCSNEDGVLQVCPRVFLNYPFNESQRIWLHDLFCEFAQYTCSEYFDLHSYAVIDIVCVTYSGAKPIGHMCLNPECTQKLIGDWKIDGRPEFLPPVPEINFALDGPAPTIATTATTATGPRVRAELHPPGSRYCASCNRVTESHDIHAEITRIQYEHFQSVFPALVKSAKA